MLTTPPPRQDFGGSQHWMSVLADQLPEGSLLNRILKGLGNYGSQHAYMLMGMGAGLAGSQSWGQCLNRAFTNALPAMRMDVQQNNQNATVNALVQRGVPPTLAMSMATNPAMMQQLLPQVFGARQLKWGKVGTDMLNNDQMGWIDEVGGRTYDSSGRLIGAVGSAMPGGVPGAGMQVLAKGVNAYNSDLPAEQYLAQFSPEMQAAINARLTGQDMTTGNPRQKGIGQAAKTFAETYAAKAGIPYSDALYQQQKDMIAGFGKSTNNSFGGQRVNGNTALSHLGTLSDLMVQMQNYGFGVGTPVAHFINSLKNSASDERASLANAYEDALDKYVKEVEKYYSGSGTGGVAEREAARERLNSSKTPAEFAQILRTEGDLFRGKLKNLEQNSDDMLRGHENAQRLVGSMIKPEGKEGIDKIERNIQVLRGKAPRQEQQTAPPTPITATNPRTGERIQLINGQWVPLR
jgi:hypothetical protein